MYLHCGNEGSISIRTLNIAAVHRNTLQVWQYTGKAEEINNTISLRKYITVRYCVQGIYGI